MTAWVDRTLRAGASWETQIQSEILKCDYFVVLYSPDINRHLNGEEESYVLTEISYAKFTAKKPIIPVMALPTAPPITLTRAHYIDYTLSGLALSDLVDAICAEAGVGVSAVSASLSTPTSVAVPAPPRPQPRLVTVTDILPPPFAWCDIPEGCVTIGNQKVLVPAFKMAKYPITYAQFDLRSSSRPRTASRMISGGRD